jgi:hypothetical protein
MQLLPKLSLGKPETCAGVMSGMSINSRGRGVVPDSNALQRHRQKWTATTTAAATGTTGCKEAATAQAIPATQGYG